MVHVGMQFTEEGDAHEIVYIVSEILVEEVGNNVCLDWINPHGIRCGGFYYSIKDIERSIEMGFINILHQETQLEIL